MKSTVTSHTSHLQQGQGVRDNSREYIGGEIYSLIIAPGGTATGVGFLPSIVDNFDSTDIFLYHNFDIIMLTVAHLSEHKKSRCV